MVSRCAIEDCWQVFVRGHQSTIKLSSKACCKGPSVAIIIPANL